jgi:hypothetical protein
LGRKRGGIREVTHKLSNKKNVFQTQFVIFEPFSGGTESVINILSGMSLKQEGLWIGGQRGPTYP